MLKLGEARGGGKSEAICRAVVHTSFYLAKQQRCPAPTFVAPVQERSGPLVSIASLEASTRHGRSGAAFHSIVYYRSFACFASVLPKVGAVVYYLRWGPGSNCEAG